MFALTVTQLNKRIKDILENEVILEHICVCGEISSFSVTRGIAYFNIKDDDSLPSCVMFGCNQNFNLGDKVQVTGNVNYYVKGGKLSLSATKIELMGQGELYQQYLLLKQRLELEGLFDTNLKKSIPRFIKRIGVITSKTGAVLQDIINVTSRRNPTVDLVLYDTQVQGVVENQKTPVGNAREDDDDMDDELIDELVEYAGKKAQEGGETPDENDEFINDEAIERQQRYEALMYTDFQNGKGLYRIGLIKRRELKAKESYYLRQKENLKEMYWNKAKAQFGEEIVDGYSEESRIIRNYINSKIST